ncbi:helix-turn-helix domain-containing protein [Actinomadura geliboluensis]|uniref:helix-turn-helix domain-containing protein n=1 Tax=Actinomadura geliboluensis TaxID=882440 RepID=UPI00371E9B86
MTHWIVSAVECRSTASVRIASVGYAKLTTESVAARAGTGIAVLYRRWPNKERLVLAALEHYSNGHPVDVPDTGGLRGDLLAALSGPGEARAGFFAIVAAAAFSGAAGRHRAHPRPSARRDPERAAACAHPGHLPACT